MPKPSRRRFSPADWLPSQRMWWWVALAFGIGLVLFALVWSRGRGQPDFYRADGTPPTSASSDADYAPLPIPAGDGGESVERDFSGAHDGADEAVVLEPEPPRTLETAPSVPPGPLAQESPTATAATTEPIPLAGRTPSPSYPARALRRGESGTVTVQAQIGPDGVPVSVTVARGSGSRDLDRAAVEAVRRWRFRPALQDGRPVAGLVNIPIEFTPRG